MLAASSEFKDHFAQSSKALVMAEVELADGSAISLSGDDLMQGGAKFSHAVSPQGSFEVGAAIAGKCDLTLNNMDGRFDGIDFDGALATVYVAAPGMEPPEWVRKGTYAVEQPDAYGGTIALSGLDAMRLLDRPYADVQTAYPATLALIVQEACLFCGVELASAAFPNSTWRVDARPEDSALTCRDVVSYAAQLGGCFARVGADGMLRIGWYDTSSGAHSGASCLGIDASASVTVRTEDVRITGVAVTVGNPDAGDGDAKSETATVGDAGYVLQVEGNPLVAYGRASEAASAIGSQVVGMAFRPFESRSVGNPLAEPGDACTVRDARGGTYASYLTAVDWAVEDYASYRCDAEGSQRHSASSYGASTRTLQAAREAVRRERSARQAAFESLSDALAASSGLYHTAEEQPDGSTVHYMHDKPQLADSRVVWKLNANAIGVSTDGGRTYPYVLDANGDAILNRIYAIGLDADHITSGRLSSRDGRNYFNLDTGDVRFLTIEEDGIGAANLLDGTGAFGGWTVHGNWSASAGVARCDAPASVSNAHLLRSPASDALSWNRVAGRTMTFGMDVRAPHGFGEPSASNDVYVCLALVDADGNRRAWRDIRLGPPAATAEWARRSFTVDMGRELLDRGEFPQSPATCHVEAWVFDKSTSAVEVRRPKLELGSFATDWCESAADNLSDATRKAVRAQDGAIAVAEGLAADAVTTAAADANAKVEAAEARVVAKVEQVAQANVEFTRSELDALDRMLGQQELFERITDGGRIKGIVKEGGQYFFNADYINSGSISANLIRAGMLASKRNGSDGKPKFSLSMETGAVRMGNAELHDVDATGAFSCGQASGYAMVLKNGELRGLDRGERISSIDITARVTHWPKGVGKGTPVLLRGLNVVAKGIIRLVAPKIGVLASSNNGDVSTSGWTGEVSYNCVSKIENLGDGRIRWHYKNHGVKCINGIVVSAW